MTAPTPHAPATRTADRVASRPPASRSGTVVHRLPRAADLDPGRFRTRRRRLERSLAIALPIALIALWQVAAELDWIDVRYFPAPTTIWSTGVELVRDGKLQEHLLASV